MSYLVLSTDRMQSVGNSLAAYIAKFLGLDIVGWYWAEGCEDYPDPQSDDEFSAAININGCDYPLTITNCQIKGGIHQHNVCVYRQASTQEKLDIYGDEYDDIGPDYIEWVPMGTNTINFIHRSQDIIEVEDRWDYPDNWLAE